MHTYFILYTKRESEVGFWDVWLKCLSDSAVPNKTELVRMLSIHEAKPSLNKLTLTPL